MAPQGNLAEHVSRTHEKHSQLLLCNHEEPSPEVQRRSISCPTKRTYVLKKIRITLNNMSAIHTSIRVCPFRTVHAAVFLVAAVGTTLTHPTRWQLVRVTEVTAVVRQGIRSRVTGANGSIVYGTCAVWNKL